MYDYYKKELSKIELSKFYEPTFKFSWDGNHATKTMNLNKESARALIEFLTPIANR